jgi:hypothetical protein
MIHINYPAQPATINLVALGPLHMQGPPFTAAEGAAAIERSHRIKKRRVDLDLCTDAEVVDSSLNEYRVL